MNMDKKLLLQALTKYFMGIFCVGVLIFLPAGTFQYWNGWLFMGILFIPMLFTLIILMLKNPSLLEKRLHTKEKEQKQKMVIALSCLMFLFGFIIAGLNYRYSWLIIPNSISIIFAVLFLIEYALYAEVLRENIYLFRTVEVQKNQKVIDTGLYGIIRHPMYLITILLFLSIPLILGSIISFFVFCAYPFIIVKRIKNEEEILEKHLEKYTEYKQKVKYRLIPFVW